MKSMFTGGCVLAAMGVLMATPGIAAATGGPLDDMTYANAAAQVAKSDASAKVVVSTVVGSVLQRNDCIVTHSTKAAFLSGTGTKSPVTYFVDLNCNGELAGAGTPGNSAASPEGRSKKAVDETLNFLNAHPEYCDQSPANHDGCVKFCKNVGPGKCTFELG